jgi:osmotically-inducible protein OsmY
VTEHAPAPARYTATGTIDPGAVPDETIKAVLARELVNDRLLSSEHVGVTVDNGIVTLQGTLETRLAKERAIAISHVVRGVRAVVDRIDVADHPRQDHELEVVVARVLSSDPVTRGQRIVARARQGRVSLIGEVESFAARQIARDDVLGIPGVMKVDENLAIFPRQRSDAQLSDLVTRFLDDDPWLDDDRVSASGDKERVAGSTLPGCVSIIGRTTARCARDLLWYSGTARSDRPSSTRTSSMRAYIPSRRPSTYIHTSSS